MPSQDAIPVRVRVTTLRNKCVEADPDFYTEGRRPIAYEFSGGKRVFREVTNTSGPYSD